MVWPGDEGFDCSRSDLTDDHKQEYLDRGWIYAEEFVGLVTETIISSTDLECNFDRPMFHLPDEWYLSRSNVIDKIRGLIEQRDHLVTLVRMLAEDYSRAQMRLEQQDLMIELLEHDLDVLTATETEEE